MEKFWWCIRVQINWTGRGNLGDGEVRLARSEATMYIIRPFGANDGEGVGCRLWGSIGKRIQFRSFVEMRKRALVVKLMAPVQIYPRARNGTAALRGFEGC